jgi:hypothetical protein
MLKPVESAVGSKGNGGVVTVETVADEIAGMSS